MKTYMLKGKIHERGMTQSEVAAAIGISEETFSFKINESRSVFNLHEARKLRTLLRLTDKEVISIFF